VRRSPGGYPTCPGFAAIEADCPSPYLPISRRVVRRRGIGRQRTLGAGNRCAWPMTTASFVRPTTLAASGTGRRVAYRRVTRPGSPRADDGAMLGAALNSPGAS
jgi:hypothetical protein